MQQNNRAQKNTRLKVGIIVTIFCVMFFVSLYFILPSFTFWPGDGNIDQVIRIGSWDMDDENQVIVTNFDDAYFVIRQADPFMQLNINRIHILGDQNNQVTPNTPTSLNNNDVLLFKIDSTIFAVQILNTQSLPPNTFDSWEHLRETIIDRTDTDTHRNPGISDDNRFRQGNVYTRFHAPVSHGGQQFLARHDNVTSTPQMGYDWFLVHPSWHPQNYPLGAIIEYNGNHYRKVLHTSQIISPANNQYWQSLVSVDIAVASAPNFASQPFWNEFSVVEYQNRYFVSLINGNTTNPLASSLWQEIHEFDRQNLVPWYGSQPHAVGDFVRHTLAGGEVAYFRRDNAGGSSIITNPYGQWRRVFNWHDTTGIGYWSPSIHYRYNDPAHANILVNYNGAIFRLVAWVSAAGVSPTDSTGWQRVRTFEESQRPIEFSSGTWPRNTIFRVGDDQDYYHSVLIATGFNQWSPHTPTSGGGYNAHFRRISAWSPTQAYYLPSFLGWGPTTRQGHAYTIDAQTNERIFWELTSTPSGSTLLGAMPSESSPFWQRVMFTTPDTILVTHIMGRAQIWDRNLAVNPVTNLQPLPPSVANNHWIQRIIGVTNAYVYTIEDGAVTLWRNSTPIPTGGNTNPIGGAGWIRIDFNSTQNFAYTINAVGLKQFWHSPNRSSFNPAVGSGDWRLIHDAIDIPDIGSEGIIVYPANGSGFYYFHVNEDGSWNKLNNAWIGNFGRMINHWGNMNRYEAGDIVVYGATMLGKFRFFEFIGDDARRAVGVSPMSEAGQRYWLAIR